MLFNPVKRKPVGEVSFKQHIEARPVHALIFVESSLESKPLKETVWDNNGPLWSIQESERIGFTQNYVSTPVVTPSGSTAIVYNKGTRFSIPFGNIFSEMLYSGSKKRFEKVDVCFDQNCFGMASIESNPYIIKIKVEEFRVWEVPINKLNYKAKISYSVQKPAKDTVHGERTFEKESVFGILSTSYTVIDQMNEITKIFAQDIVANILKEI